MRLPLALICATLAWPAWSAEPAAKAALARLDAVGRAIAATRCQRPQEVKTRLLPSTVIPGANDEMQTHDCRGFRLTLYLHAPTPGAAAREQPMSVLVERGHPLLDGIWSIGARAVTIRSRLGAPLASTEESLSYALDASGTGRNRLSFEIEAGVVRGVSWSWAVD